MTNLNPRHVKLIEVLYRDGTWHVVIHYVDTDREPWDQETYETQEQAAAAGRTTGRWIAESQGSPVQIHFKTKDGKIPKGQHGTATYGHDPEETVG